MTGSYPDKEQRIYQARTLKQTGRLHAGERPFTVRHPWWHYFPLYWLFQAVRAVTRLILGPLIGPLILKATNKKVLARRPCAGSSEKVGGYYTQTDPTDQQLEAFIQKIARSKDCPVNSDRLWVRTPDKKTKLDTLILRQQGKTQITPKTKAVIIAPGNTYRFEHDYAIKLMVTDIKKRLENDPESDTLVLAFNYGKVGRSTGPLGSYQHLVRSLESQMDYLIDLGVDPKNIEVRAHSLGGGVACCAVRNAHRYGLEARLFNDRSYRNISSIVRGMIKISFERAGWPKLGKIISWIALPFVKLLVVFSDWEIDALTPATQINARYLDLCVLRTAHQDRSPGFYGDDRVIDYDASLYSGLKHQKQAGLFFSRHDLKKTMSKVYTELKQKNPDSPDIAWLESFRTQLRRRKLIDCDDEGKPTHKNGHSSNWANLHNRWNGESVLESNYQEFIESTPEEHWLVKGDHRVKELADELKAERRSGCSVG
ncbi:MAG: hypothetical protein V4490_04670 [Pseudomonadota bacterium]